MLYQKPLHIFLFISCLFFFISCKKEGSSIVSEKDQIENQYKLNRPSIGKELIQGEVHFLSDAYKADNRIQLNYELNILNSFRKELRLDRIELVDVSNDTSSFMILDKEYVLNNLFKAGQNKPIDSLMLSPSILYILSINVSLIEDANLPKRFFHRLIFEIKNRDGSKAELAFDVALQKFPNLTELTLAMPFKEGKWFYTAESHKNSRYLTEGSASYPQRFAIDWAYIESDGTFVSGNENKNESYPTYGLDILAVADGEVTVLIDDLPDNEPNSNETAVRINRETVCGNFIQLDIGDNINAIYGHLIPGSIKVQSGDKVKKGQVLASLGNSGNSDGPHLHFHLETDSPLTLGGEGIPYHFEKFTQLKNYSMEEMEHLFDNTTIDVSSSSRDKRINQLPIGNGLIEFE